MKNSKEGITKKLAGYAVWFLGILLVFVICYQISYKRAFKQLTNQKEEKDYDLLMELRNASVDNLSNSANQQTEEGLEAGILLEKVKPSARFLLESYDVITDQVVKEELALPGEYVGLKREEVTALLSSYMDDIPISEYEKGLFAFELLSFSEDALTIRKSYNPNRITFKYYVAVKDGYVIVYYSDLKTVYEYTKITAFDLPDQERLRLMDGIYLDTNAELYELLENYSS